MVRHVRNDLTPMSGQRWRDDDDEYLLSCWGAGQERQVARDLGRSVKACEERAEVLGITRSRNWWREEREIA